MDRGQMKQQVTRFWDGFNKGDSEGALSLASQDIVFTVTGTATTSGTHRGKEALRGHLQRFADLVLPGGVMHVEELIAEGDTVVCLSRGVMRARTGREYNNRYAFVFRFSEEKIAAVTEYWDTVLAGTSLFGKSIL